MFWINGCARCERVAMRGTMGDLAALLRNPRRWWFNATHAPCIVCGERIHVGRQWHEHKATHE